MDLGSGRTEQDDVLSEVWEQIAPNIKFEPGSRHLCDFFKAQPCPKTTIPRCNRDGLVYSLLLPQKPHILLLSRLRRRAKTLSARAEADLATLHSANPNRADAWLQAKVFGDLSVFCCLSLEVGLFTGGCKKGASNSPAAIMASQQP